MFGAVCTWVLLITLRWSEKAENPGDIRRTFSFRALHCGQPLRDFRCDLLGPIIKQI
jgi:hypothetical protein